MRIKLSYVVDLIEKRSIINRVPFKDIVWTDDDDNAVAVPDGIKEEFRFTGLINTDFVHVFYNQETKKFDFKRES